MKPRALVVGLGGIGTICALTLEENAVFDVDVIVRNQDEEFQKQGFQITSVIYGERYYKPKSIYKSVQEASVNNYDYVIVTTKNLPDSDTPTVDLVAPVVGPNTTVILVQNGLGIELPILERFPNNLVMSGIVLTGSSRYGNKVNHVGIDEILFGYFKACKLPKEESVRLLHRFVDAYKRDDNRITIDEDVEYSRWYKLCYNSVYNTVCAILGVDLTRCQIVNGNKNIFNKLLGEIIAIAASEGYNIKQEHVDYIMHVSDGRFYTPSMQIDREKGNLMELEVILGSPLQVAHKNGVDAPNLTLIYDMLKVLQFTFREKQGEFTLKKEDFKVNSDEAPKVFSQLYNKSV